MKNHDKRDDDPLGARRIDKHQRVTCWLRPNRPTWMSQPEYDELPEQIEIRLVDVIIEQAGFRSKKYTIATTILETEVTSRQWITNVYRSRWLVLNQAKAASNIGVFTWPLCRRTDSVSHA